jgi:D-serine deaminase-like pyridoxal phosphate-dependent protein
VNLLASLPRHKRLALLVFGAAVVVALVGFGVGRGFGNPDVPSGDIAVVEDVPDDLSHISREQFDRSMEQTAARAGLDVRGVFTFPGHSYAPDKLGQAAADEARALTGAAESLRTAGIEPTVVSGGSTPSLASADTDVLTELRPGVYVFGDAQQWELGSMAPDDIALACRATVVSHSGGRLVLDAGSKALGADRAPWASGYGRLLEHPEARVVLLSEHHAVADLGDAPLPAIGSPVDVVPNHVCNAVNLADTLYVEDAGVLTAWPVVARGQNG